VVLSGLAAGCGSRKPAYCTAASQLKTSVHDLGNVTVNVSDLSSVKPQRAKSRLTRRPSPASEVGITVADLGAAHLAVRRTGRG
jgi:hypothetical protein